MELQLPQVVKFICLIGGLASGQNITIRTLCFDPSTNQWTAMANMPTEQLAKRSDSKCQLVVSNEQQAGIWAIADK